MFSPRSKRSFFILWIGLLMSTCSFAQEQQPSQGASDLAKQLSNPVASLISVPFQGNWEFGVGPEDDTRFVLNFQPVIPFSMNKDWNLISRTILPMISQPSLVEGAQPTFGIGDIVQSFFLSPNKTQPFIWGAGPALLVPATADPFLGTEKWGLGPTAVVLKQSGQWTYGALFNHIWSFAGDDDRADVNQTLLQPFLSYGTKSGVTYTINTESTANWEAADGQKWTVPINLSFSKVTRIGKRPVSFALGAGYFAEKPDGGPSWKLRFSTTFIFPR